MADKMKSLDQQFRFVLVKNTNEAVPEANFKIEVINKRLSICLRRVWVYFRILYLFLCGIVFSSSVYVVDEMSPVVALFKLTGHKVVYYRKDKNVGSGIDSFITDLMLIPSAEGTLTVQKHVVVDPVEVAEAIDALVRLSKHETLPSITMVIQSQEKR